VQAILDNGSFAFSVADNAGTMEFTRTAQGTIGSDGLTVTNDSVAVTNAASPTTGAYDTITFGGANESIVLTLVDDSTATGLNLDKDSTITQLAARLEEQKSATSTVSFSAENGKLKVTHSVTGNAVDLAAGDLVFSASSTTVTPTITQGGGDSTRISGTLKFVSSSSFSVEQAGNAAGNKGYFAAGSQTATLVDLTQVKISTEAGASDAISIIDAALDKVAQMRSDLGAIENRMDHTISNLMNIAEKTADSRSRLEDADFALESARLAKNQVLQQAGTSMLSQANQMSQMVMELLRG
jgi:flagellin